jgi:hypothetical protein
MTNACCARALVGAVARYGGDRELADQARALADKWLADHSAVPAESGLLGIVDRGVLWRSQLCTTASSPRF